MIKAKAKGFLVPSGYMGLINGKYMLFETEQAYKEYLNDKEEENYIIEIILNEG